MRLTLQLLTVCIGLFVCRADYAEEQTQSRKSQNTVANKTEEKIEIKTGNHKNKSFRKAKRLLQKIYSRHRITLYCSCRFYKDKTIDRKSCGYVPRKESSRSQRIEWEHVVPAENFGRSFSAWREGHVKCQNSKGKNYKGRKCARKVEKSFRYMEADMYNLYPAIGELNMLRSNYSLYMVPGEKREFGKCDFEVEDRLAEPPENVRGDIARTYFYMNQVYPGHGIVGKNKRKLLQIWDKQDPVDAWECKRARKIRKLQGNTNHIVENRCKERGL